MAQSLRGRGLNFQRLRRKTQWPEVVHADSVDGISQEGASPRIGFCFRSECRKRSSAICLPNVGQAVARTSVGMHVSYGAQISEGLKSLAAWQAVEEESSTNFWVLLGRSSGLRVEAGEDGRPGRRRDRRSFESLPTASPTTTSISHPLDEGGLVARPPQGNSGRRQGQPKKVKPQPGRARWWNSPMSPLDESARRILTCGSFGSAE